MATDNGFSVKKMNIDGSSNVSGLRHNPGLSLYWTAAEQAILEENLAKCGSVSRIYQYAAIAMQLKDKTVRDVALRCKWMSMKEDAKLKKEDHGSAKRRKDRKHMEFSAAAVPTEKNWHAVPKSHMENDVKITYKDVGGLTGELLEQNSQMLEQVSANLTDFKDLCGLDCLQTRVHSNIFTLSRIRDNLTMISSSLEDVPEKMKRMPPLPVMIDEEMASLTLSPPPLPAHTLNSPRPLA